MLLWSVSNYLTLEDLAGRQASAVLEEISSATPAAMGLELLLSPPET